MGFDTIEINLVEYKSCYQKLWTKVVQKVGSNELSCEWWGVGKSCGHELSGEHELWTKGVNKNSVAKMSCEQNLWKKLSSEHELWIKVVNKICEHKDKYLKMD